MPDRYEASARVFVDTQSVLKPLLSGLAVQPNTEQQVMMMSRTLISRPNLERVVRMSDMDIRLKTSGEKERLLDSLASSIQILSTGRDNLYTISYRDTKPEDAKRVVQSLLTIFVEGSLGDKRKDADSAKRFIDEQIKAYEQKLVLAENSLKEFKRQHVGMMPSQGRDYQSRLEAAVSKLEQAKLELREVEQSRDAIKKQLVGEEPVLLAESTGGGGVTPTPAGFAASPLLAELEGRINALKQKLDGLRLTYTERHPDIVAAKRVLDQIEEQKKQELEILKAKRPPPSAEKAAPRGPGQVANPVVQQLTVSLAEAEASVAVLKTRVRPTFNDKLALQEATGLPILGMVAMRWNADHLSRRRKGMVAVLLSFLGLLGSYAAVIAFVFATGRA